MGAALIIFLPGQISFNDYFQWKDSDSDVDMAVKFLVELCPKAPCLRHRKQFYLMRIGIVFLKQTFGGRIEIRFRN